MSLRMRHYEISSIKENINKEILKLIKESSIDCRIHSRNSESKRSYNVIIMIPWTTRLLHTMQI